MPRVSSAATPSLQVMGQDRCCISDLLSRAPAATSVVAERKMSMTMCRVPSRYGHTCRQLIAHVGEGLDVDEDRGEPALNTNGVEGNRRQREAHHVCRVAGITQGRRCRERLLRDRDPAPGTVGGRAGEHPG